MMKKIIDNFITRTIILVLCALMSPAWSDGAEDPFLNKLMSLKESQIPALLEEIAKTGDEKYDALLDSYRSGSLFAYEDKVYYNIETFENDDFDEFFQPGDAFSHEPVVIEGLEKGALGASLVPYEDLEELSPGRKVRKEISKARMVIGLYSKDREKKLTAIKKAAFTDGALSLVPTLEKISHSAESKKDSKLEYVTLESIGIIKLREGEDNVKSGAIESLGELQSLRAYDLLKETFALEETSDFKKEKINAAISEIEGHQFRVQIFDLIKSGLSSGSILIILALGLSITFGMMGVINMAHGELMMIGAYTTYCTQLIFGHSATTPNDAYFFFALPASFIMAMLIGGLIEVCVVSKLYKNPLESLLATYGIGLIMIQIVRIQFGDNCPSNSPTWLQGGFEISQDMMLQYNRLFVFLLTLFCLGVVIYIFKYTSLGLKMKASMQNREMASAMGINTRKVDLFTFMLGSGMAGVAGNAMTTLSGISPGMGQNHIVDSFLVVVTGGVGNVFGVVCSGLGLGMTTKTLETFFFDSVWSKILVLVIVIIFIQFRPSGIFALKGRSADD